jgi:hypothetical protein
MAHTNFIYKQHTAINHFVSNFFKKEVEEITQSKSKKLHKQLSTSGVDMTRKGHNTALL